MKKKMMAMLMTTVMAATMLAGCGGSGEATEGQTGNTTEEVAAEEATEAAADAANTYVFERNVLNADEVELPPYIFTKFDTVRAVRVELNLAQDNTFTMDVHGWMQEDTEGSDRAVGEAFEYGDGMYAEYFSSADGTYEKDGDTVVIHAEEASYEIPDLGVSYIAQTFASSNAAGGSFNPEGDVYYGTWTSTEVPEVLELFPDTVFSIEGDSIATWEKTGRLTAAENEKASIVFYNDGTAFYKDIENGLRKDMTWSVDGSDVTLTYTGAEGAGTIAVGNASAPVEITLRQYKDASNYDDFTQSIQLSEENISALQ